MRFPARFPRFRPRQLVARALAAAALVISSSCVVEEVPDEGAARTEVFEPPADLDNAFISTGVYHGVAVFCEFNPQTDLPPGSPPSLEHSTAVLPMLDGDREVYRAFAGLHQFVYSNRAFEIGGMRYPAEPGATLYILKSREGPLRFRYRGQEIIIDSRAPWVPAVSLHQERGFDEPSDAGDGIALRGRTGTGASKRRSVSHVREILRVARFEIVVDSRHEEWLIRGEPHRPNPDRPLRITGAVDFGG